MSSANDFAAINEAIDAYRSLMVSEEFREYVRMREKAELRELYALNRAREEARAEADKKWQSVVDEKDAELSAKDAEIAELKAKLGIA